ncbi:MAG: cupin domain-containing protein, partial [Paracoccaceae bacterium]
MQIYTPGTEIGVLQPWPFDNPESNYKILFGAPAASGRIDTGGAGYTTRSGIWRCTAGTFECTEQGDELMTLLSGRCHLTDQSTGKSHELGAGDSLFMPDGRRVTWEIIQEVTKVFFGNKP